MKMLYSLRRDRATPTRQSRAASGFTLTEILIAIALIVTIVAVAVANLGQIFTGGQIDVARTFVKESIDTPLMSYRMATGSYPTTEQGLRALIVAPADVPNWRGPYLQTPDVPLDPWSRPYQYQYPGTHNGTQKYDVWSVGPDGQNGTDDDIGNW
jgi:general secretion pathway protein G